MNELTTFCFKEGREVRTLERDGEPWFVAKDVCDILDIENARDAIRNFPEDEKMTLKRGEFSGMTVASTDGQNGHGGAQFLNIVNEPGLYRLIFQSRKPEAEAFKRWVFHEVLPSIRRKGYYAVSQLQVRLEEALATIGIETGHLDVIIRRNAELKRMLQETARLNAELANIVKQNWPQPQTLEVIPDRLDRDMFHVNLPIARFVAENLDFTMKDSDIIPVYVAYQVYLAYTANPVGEQAFGGYIADRYPDTTVTKRKTHGVDQAILRRCRFRVYL